MKTFLLPAVTLVVVVALAASEPPVSKRPFAFHTWPQKNSKQINFGRSPNGQKRTLVVQIRSDQPVPLVLKGRPGSSGHSHAYSHAHAHSPTHAHALLHHHHNPHVSHVRGLRPLKLTSSQNLKNIAGQLYTKQAYQKPLKLKLTNVKQQQQKYKTSLSYEKPFKYEKPFLQVDSNDAQKLPLETHANFVSDHFAPIHTIPAPNLALHDNHLHAEDTYLPPHTPKPQKYHTSTTTQSTLDGNNHYQVVEEITNDHTIRDPLSGSQKLFAPDPDPSLPASKIRPAKEPFNQPSNGKPLPTDVQNNYISPAQPLVQIVNPQQAAPEIYPIQYSHQAQIQHFGAAVQPAAIPIYNPTYLVQQSNNLYTQHKQQLFRPETNVVEVGYVNADLTQEVASDGQILQAAKDPRNNIHPVLDSAPQFAALIAAPVLNEAQNSVETAPFQLTNVAAGAPGSPEGGFVVSNFYNHNPQDSSQLLQAYAEEEAQRQPLEIEQASYELQLQQQQQQQLEQLQYGQQQQQQHFEHLQLQQQQQQQDLLLQQQQNQLFDLQQQHYNQQHPQQQALHQQQLFDINPRQQQQPTQNSPLRIFVPDDEPIADLPRLQKRADTHTRGTVEDVKVSSDQGHDSQNGSFEVTSSVEVSSSNKSDRQ